MPEITQEQIDKVFEELKKRFADKVKKCTNKMKNGGIAFNSRAEVYGKLSEEHYECLMALHAKKKNTDFVDELYDVMIVACRGIASEKNDR